MFESMTIFIPIKYIDLNDEKTYYLFHSILKRDKLLFLNFKQRIFYQTTKNSQKCTTKEDS